MKNGIIAEQAIVLTIGVQGKYLGTSNKNYRFVDGNTTETQQKKKDKLLKELEKVNINEMIKQLPFLEKKEIEDAHVVNPKIKLPKQSKVSSVKTEVLKIQMKNLHTLLANNEISKLSKNELNIIRKDKVKNIFYELAKGTPEWHKAIRRVAEAYTIRY